MHAAPDKVLWLSHPFMVQQHCAHVLCMQDNYLIMAKTEESERASMGAEALLKHRILHRMICHMPYSKHCLNTRNCSKNDKDPAQLWKKHMATLCTCSGRKGCVHPTHWCLYEYALVSTPVRNSMLLHVKSEFSICSPACSLFFAASSVMPGTG